MKIPTNNFFRFFISIYQNPTDCLSTSPNYQSNYSLSLLNTPNLFFLRIFFLFFFSLDFFLIFENDTSDFSNWTRKILSIYFLMRLEVDWLRLISIQSNF